MLDAWCTSRSGLCISDAGHSRVPVFCDRTSQPGSCGVFKRALQTQNPLQDLLVVHVNIVQFLLSCLAIKAGMLVPLSLPLLLSVPMLQAGKYGTALGALLIFTMLSASCWFWNEIWIARWLSKYADRLGFMDGLIDRLLFRLTLDHDTFPDPRFDLISCNFLRCTLYLLQHISLLSSY
jgi:hypothetical protein